MPFVQYKALHEELTALANAGIDSLNTNNYLKDNLYNNGEYRWSCSAKLLQMLGYYEHFLELLECTFGFWDIARLGTFYSPVNRDFYSLI
jgi:hypothetical protein